MRFLAYDLALDLIRNLREPLAAIRRHDAALAKQARDALNSVAMNIAEGSGRNGGAKPEAAAAAFTPPGAPQPSRVPSIGRPEPRRPQREVESEPADHSHLPAFLLRPVRARV